MNQTGRAADTALEPDLLPQFLGSLPVPVSQQRTTIVQAVQLVLQL